MRGGDEGTVFSRPAEDDVARLISHQQGAHDAAAVLALGQLHDADAVGEVVDNPDLVVIARRDGHRLEADRNGGAVLQPMVLDAKDFEAAVRCIGHEKELPARRQGQRAYLAALEEREAPRLRRRGLEVSQAASSSPCGQRGGKTEKDRQRELQQRDRTAWGAQHGHGDLL